jgi:sodium-coupled neutral amino acid transporter 2
MQGLGNLLVPWASLFMVLFVAVHVHSVWTPLQLIGSTAGVCVAFVLPGLVAGALEGGEGASMQRWMGGLMMWVGIVLGAAGITRLLFLSNPGAM